MTLNWRKQKDFRVFVSCGHVLWYIICSELARVVFGWQMGALIRVKQDNMVEYVLITWWFMIPEIEDRNPCLWLCLYLSYLQFDILLKFTYSYLQGRPIPNSFLFTVFTHYLGNCRVHTKWMCLVLNSWAQEQWHNNTQYILRMFLSVLVVAIDHGVNEIASRKIYLFLHITI